MITYLIILGIACLVYLFSDLKTDSNVRKRDSRKKEDPLVENGYRPLQRDYDLEF